MAILTIRDLDKDTEAGLHQRAANHGRSMEEEARLILIQAVQAPITEKGLGTRIHDRFAAIGGIELPPPERTPIRQPPDFSDIGNP